MRGDMKTYTDRRIYSSESAKVWGAMWLFGVVPLMIGVGYVAIKQQLEEIEHAKKHYEEHGPPKFLPAPYMRKRTSVSVPV